MLHGKFTVQFPLYSITSTRSSVKPRKACFNHTLISVVLLSLSLIIFFFARPWASYSNSQIPDRGKVFKVSGSILFHCMWQGQESANYPFSQHFGNPSKWSTVSQSLLKAGWSVVSRAPGCCSTCSQSPLSPCVLGEKRNPQLQW